MNFQGHGRPMSTAGMVSACDSLDVQAQDIWAVLHVETHAVGFLPDRRPQILFERHKFHLITNGQFDASHPDISNKLPGGYVGNGGEYLRLQSAIELDRSAAIESTSWGVGQVMGFNFALAGFASVEEMVAGMVIDEDTQLAAMATFIRNTGLAVALRAGDWPAIARVYNGKDFKKNDYDTLLAAAHARYAVAQPNLILRAAQAALLYLGIDPGPIDGFRGRLTRSAVAAFQQRSGLPVTGQLDPETQRRLTAAAFPAQ